MSGGQLQQKLWVLVIEPPVVVLAKPQILLVAQVSKKPWVTAQVGVQVQVGAWPLW